MRESSPNSVAANQSAPAASVADDDALYGVADGDPIADSDPSPTTPQPALALVCPVCSQDNTEDALVCTRCGAGLHRKYLAREPEPVATGGAARQLVKRRRLLTSVGVTLLMTLLGAVGWMVIQAVKVIETPTLAYQRIAKMAEANEWERVVDRLHPKTLTSAMRSTDDPDTAKRQLKIALREEPKFLALFLTLKDVPLKDFTITGEIVEGDVATLQITEKSGGKTEIIMRKAEGIWKLDISERGF